MFKPITKEQLKAEKAKKLRIKEEKLKKEKRFLKLLVIHPYI
jgi:hypothetical protein